MRKIGVAMSLVMMAIVSLSYAASKTRMLLEDVGPDQRLERFHSLPVIISEKTFRVVISPETIMPESSTTLYFNLLINNTTQSALAFSIDHLSAYAAGKKLKILAPEEVIAESRRYYSREEYGISADQEKELGPFVAEQMERLSEKLMKNQLIHADSSAAGMIAVHVPFGTDGFTIAVETEKDHHYFKFNVGEF